MADYQNRCYATVLDDCGGGMSREHYISRSLLEIFTGHTPIVTGFPWQRAGEQLRTTAANLATNVLCETHNNALSPLDERAGEFF
jgi:hypothetical protein